MNRTSGRGRDCFRVAGAIACLLLGGCFNPFSPKVASSIGISEPAPSPSSAVNVVRLYEWCWNHRDPQLYREILTEDFRFAFAVTDSAGNAYRDRTLTRDEELEIAENIFVRGTANEPPPVSIRLTFDPNLRPVPDSRLGKDPGWHVEIQAQTLLRIEVPDIEVTGVTRFFLVRGDSADIPTELESRFPPDRNRWWIERIEDETLADHVAVRVGPVRAAEIRRALRTGLPGAIAASGGSASAAELPVRITWGRLRAYFDESRTGMARSR